MLDGTDLLVIYLLMAEREKGGGQFQQVFRKNHRGEQVYMEQKKTNQL